MRGQKYPKQRGQGVIEYAGALIVAATIVSLLATGMMQNNWMFNAYNAIITAAMNMIIAGAGNI